MCSKNTISQQFIRTGNQSNGNTLKKYLLFFLILIILLNYSCTIRQKYLTFTGEDRHQVIKPSDIDRAEKVKDINSRVIVNVYLNQHGTIQLSEFINKLIGHNVTIKYGDTVLYEQIPVQSEVTSGEISIVVNSEELADDMVDQLNQKIKN